MYLRIYRGFFRLGMKCYTRGIIYCLPFGKYHVVGKPYGPVR